MKVFFVRLAYRIGQVSEKHEVKVGIPIAQETHLKVVDQFAHLLFVYEQRGNRDECDAVARNTRGEVQFRQRLRIEKCGDGIVDQLDSILGCGNQEEKN